jgi:ribonuclease HII
MNIVGIDEVGRGCWAGPLVACAAILHTPVVGLRDSKKLTAKQRLVLALQLRASAHYGLGWVTPEEIDQLGLTAAVSLAMSRALEQLTEPYTEVIIDGNYNYLPDVTGVSTLVKADDLVPSVSAASILAKVARDRYMTKLGEKLPLYGFEKHVGYGTKLHREALARHGVTSAHRRSYRPVQALL